MLDCLPISKPTRSAVPTFEPVTLQEAKKQCELADAVDHHDLLIDSLIQLAREQVEHDTGIVACTGSFVYRMTNWPNGEWFSLPDVRPITAVSSITYVDTSGNTSTFSSGDYSLDTNGVKQFVKLGHSKTWPSLRGDINGITVTFSAGYATRNDIPQLFKQAVLFVVARDFANREGMHAKPFQDGYDRIVRLLGRSTYP
jgi:uncharacterized phiE125 gp8 family phage protein